MADGGGGVSDASPDTEGWDTLMVDADAIEATFLCATVVAASDATGSCSSPDDLGSCRWVPDRVSTVYRRRVGITRIVGGVTMSPIAVVMVGNVHFAQNTGSDVALPIEHYNLRLVYVVGSTLGKRLMGAPLSVQSDIQM